MDKGKVMGGSEGNKEAIDKGPIEGVTVEAEDLERTRPRPRPSPGGRGRGRGCGEERE